jgi:hypothetical protein
MSGAVMLEGDRSLAAIICWQTSITYRAAWSGQIIDFKVMLRPLKAINIVHEKMGALLKRT